MKVDYSLFPGRKIEKEEYEEKEPIFTVITPYYNASKYVDTTMKSLLNQTFPYWEWIITDDGCKDQKELEKLKEIEKQDKRIKVVHKENEGPAVARDYAAKFASKLSKYIVLLDTDDMINKTYLECVYWTLETNQGATWAYCDSINFDGNEFTWTKWFQPRKMLKENLLVITGVIRKDAFFKVGGFGFKEKKIYEDWCLWLKLMREGMYPVRMSFYGCWYRQKPLEESQLRQSNTENKERAMYLVNQIVDTIEETKPAIQYPKEDYNWEEITEEKEEIIIPKIKNKQKKQILMMIPWMTTGGADKFNLDIIKRMNHEKYEFTILTTEPNANDWRQDFEEYATVYDLTSFLDRKYWTSFVNYIIQKKKIDLIFNTNSQYGYAILPYLKVKYPTIPIIDYIHMEEWYWRNGGYSRDSSSIASVIDKTYICNKNSEKILVDYFKRNPKDVETMYIGVDEKVFDPNKFDKKSCLEDLKINKDGKFIISYICRIAEQKRPYLLLEIIKRLQERRKDVLFVIAGDGPFLAEMKKKAKSYKIIDNMVFLGNVKDTSKVYAISDITINCSIKEGLALTAYESLAMGVPVISSDVGGQKELVNEKVGVIVPCMQKEEDIFNFDYQEQEIMPYVEGIEKILNNLEEYKKEARKRILNGFTIDNMIENMEEAFEKTIENPNQDKINSAQNMQEHIDICKELITKYFIASSPDYDWLAKEFNRKNVDRDWKFDKEENKRMYYERTLEYKIKHPFYVLLNKLHIYEKLKKIIKRGE